MPDRPLSHEKTWRWWTDSKAAKRFSRLEQAFMIGASDEMACMNAGITRDQLVYYETKVDLNYRQRKALLKQNPALVALNTIARELASDPEMAKWYAERKLDDFRPKVQVQGAADEKTMAALEMLAQFTGRTVMTDNNNAEQSGHVEGARAGEGVLRVAGEAAGDSAAVPAAVSGDSGAEAPAGEREGSDAGREVADDRGGDDVGGGDASGEVHDIGA